MRQVTRTSEPLGGLITAPWLRVQSKVYGATPLRATTEQVWVTVVAVVDVVSQNGPSTVRLPAAAGSTATTPDPTATVTATAHRANSRTRLRRVIGMSVLLIRYL